ncbi:MAG TPA: MFS transporter [Streptosporangiaceae bacterium]|nr:MFS transporter [Streptosporangiaceae bacterium]
MTVIFFALFGSLFVLTRYLHGYSPLSAGLRALPFAIAMAATSPVSPILARRFGTRLVIPAGIALMGAGLLDLSTVGVHTAYPPLALAVAIMGAGMGLVMAPASTTIMTTVPAHQAGVGGAINDTIREVGGALGIAIVGSLSAAVYRSRLGSTLAAAHAPHLIRHLATSSVAAADWTSSRRRATPRWRRAGREPRTLSRRPGASPIRSPGKASTMWSSTTPGSSAGWTPQSGRVPVRLSPSPAEPRSG